MVTWFLTVTAFRDRKSVSEIYLEQKCRGNDGGWLVANNYQIEAYHAFIAQEGAHKLKNHKTSTRDYYWVRSRSNSQSNGWCEIHDRTGEHK